MSRKMDQKLMADLEALIRLRRHTVEEKQKVLADIYRQVESFENSEEASEEDEPTPEPAVKPPSGQSTLFGGEQ